MKLKVAAFDCEVKGQEPFQLLFESQAHSDGESFSRVLCTSEFDSNRLIGFLDNIARYKPKNLPKHISAFDDFLGIMEMDAVRKDCFIREIKVHPEKRDAGIGTSLLKGGLAAQSRFIGLSNISGFIQPEDVLKSEDWERLRKFYQGSGFTLNKIGDEFKSKYPNKRLAFSGKMIRNDIKTELLYNCWQR
ncbi:MAG: hypothetical protein FWE16_01680 [Firmicutes bacterium]|nr:hypothetical protein [Bacillota bacterium]